MPLLASVATPRISTGYVQGRTKLDNLMLAKMRKRGVEPQPLVPKPFVGKPLHGFKRGDELRSTIRINKVVTGMDTYSNHLSLLSKRNCIGY